MRLDQVLGLLVATRCLGKHFADDGVHAQMVCRGQLSGGQLSGTLEDMPYTPDEWAEAKVLVQSLALEAVTQACGSALAPFIGSRLTPMTIDSLRQAAIRAAKAVDTSHVFYPQGTHWDVVMVDVTSLSIIPPKDWLGQ